MRVIMPSALNSYTGGRKTIEGEGRSLVELMAFLDARFPGVRHRVIDEQDRIRPHIRFFVSGEMATTLERPLSENDEVLIVAALSGG